MGKGKKQKRTKEYFFLLEDGSYALLDYESSYRIRNKVKYAGYVLRLLRRLQNDGANIADLNIRIIVLYTADVTRQQTKDTLNVGDLIICTTEAFLMEIQSEEVKARIRQKRRKKSSATMAGDCSKRPECSNI